MVCGRLSSRRRDYGSSMPQPDTALTLYDATREYGVHRQRARKLLFAAGYIRSEDLDDPPGKVVLKPGAREFLSNLAESMSLIKAAAYLGIPRPHERVLFEAGFLVPFIRGGTRLVKDHAFRKRDLDAFLDRLAASARDLATDELVSIPVAAKQANCSAAEIVGLLLDGKLIQVGRDPLDHGYTRIRVSVIEIKPFVRLAEHGHLAIREVERRAGWSGPVVKALIDGGHLATVEVINPVKRNKQTVVPVAALAEFRSRYVSLQQLAGELGIHFLKLKTSLSEAGVSPAASLALVPTTFYKRSDLLPNA